MVFHGHCRADDHVRAHIHESPGVMTVPLAILAFGSIFAGWVGTPEYLWHSPWEDWLSPVFGAAQDIHHEALATEIFLMLLTLVIVALGILLAYLAYGRPGRLAERAASLAGGGPYRVLLNKYYVDELYDLLMVRPFTIVSGWLAQIFDPRIIDGAVNGIANGARGLSARWRGMQSGDIQHYLIGFVAGTLALLAYYLAQP
jgi:NADH-quinone oxidoreductase subunit L